MKVTTLKVGKPARTIVARINTTIEEVKERGGFTSGADTAEIDVTHDDGQVTRFFISLRVNGQGRAVCEVATNSRDGENTTSKRVTGTKR